MYIYIYKYTYKYIHKYIYKWIALQESRLQWQCHVQRSCFGKELFINNIHTYIHMWKSTSFNIIIKLGIGIASPLWGMALKAFWKRALHIFLVVLLLLLLTCQKFRPSSRQTFLLWECHQSYRATAVRTEWLTTSYVTENSLVWGQQCNMHTSTPDWGREAY